MDQPRKTKFLTVEDSFLIEGRGVVVAPKIPVGAYSGSCPCVVTLRKPNGEETTATASLDIPRVSPSPSEFYFLCLIEGVAKKDVPVGTEIWIDVHTA